VALPDAALTVRSLGYESATAQELVAAMPEFSPVDAADYAPPRGDFVVAMAGATAVGCAGFVQVDEGLAELTLMFVRTDWRRRGVASLLLRDIEERAWASGYGALRLQVQRRAAGGAGAVCAQRVPRDTALSAPLRR